MKCCCDCREKVVSPLADGGVLSFLSFLLRNQSVGAEAALCRHIRDSPQSTTSIVAAICLTLEANYDDYLQPALSGTAGRCEDAMM